MDMQTNLLTREEKARELKITKRSLDRRRKSGKIDTIYVQGKPFFLPEVVDEAN